MYSETHCSRHGILGRAMELWLPDGFNSGGFEWTCDHWGTKWNAVRVKVKLRRKVSNDDLLRAFIKFDIAWSPTIPVIEKLAAMFPNNFFDLASFDSGIVLARCYRAYHPAST